MHQCKKCGGQFQITDKEKLFYQKIDVPAPTHCPDCRQQQRLLFRNERTLYQRSCDLCKKTIVSIYSPDKPFTVYCQDCFWSDQWDALKFGKDLNLQKDFFEQYRELMLVTPRLAIINKQSENSAYCNYSFANKNCYLTFGNHYEEDCMFGHYATKNKDCIDYLQLYESELCYECIFSKKCYRSVYLDHCEESQDCYFSVDLKDCKNCFFSSNLRHKEYYIFNQPYSKEEYFKKLATYQLNTQKGFQRAKDFYFGEFRTKFPFRSVYQINSENCVGNNNNSSKNLEWCFDTGKCEDCMYGCQMDETYSSLDINCSGYDRCEADYQTIGCSGTSYCIAADSCWHDSNLMYCSLTFSSQNCFGCISLNQKNYCILNKQYSKEEYEKLVPQIIGNLKKSGQWGAFFPQFLSPFAYNETVAQEYFPVTKNAGFSWKEEDKKEYLPQKITVPEKIEDVGDEFIGGVLSCKKCSKNYKILPRELAFYRKLKLPIPQHCLSCRHQERLSRRNPRKLWSRKCDKCQQTIQSVYAPERTERVFCEKCYLNLVYN